MAVKSVGNFANVFSDHVEHIKIGIELITDEASATRYIENVIPARAARLGDQIIGPGRGQFPPSR